MSKTKATGRSAKSISLSERPVVAPSREPVTPQADFIMDNITAILAAHGASLADVVNIRTFVTDMGQLPEYGKVRAARFTGTPPTITTVEVSRLWVPGALLEVEVLAIT